MKKTIYFLPFLLFFSCQSTPETTEKNMGKENVSVQEPISFQPQKETKQENTAEKKSENVRDAGFETVAEKKSEEILETRVEAIVATEKLPEKLPEVVVETVQEQSQGSITSGSCATTEPKCPADYLCRHDVSPNLCHKSCDPDGTAFCPSNSHCLVLDTGQGMCVTGSSVAKGGVCDVDKVCEKGLLCILSAQGSSKGKCYTRCTRATMDVCNAGEYCHLVHMNNGVCLPGQHGSKQSEDPCTSTKECQKGLLCFTPYQKSARCTELCNVNVTCPSGKVCADLQSAQNGSGACSS